MQLPEKVGKRRHDQGEDPKVQEPDAKLSDVSLPCSFALVALLSSVAKQVFQYIMYKNKVGNSHYLIVGSGSKLTDHGFFLCRKYALR